MTTFDNAVRLAKKYDPRQPRDAQGQWSDKLGLRGRAAPDVASMLRGSGRVGDRQRDSELALLALRGPDGPEVRIGQVTEGDAATTWRGRNLGGTARFAGADADRLDDELSAVGELHAMVEQDMKALRTRLAGSKSSKITISEDSELYRARRRGSGAWETLPETRPPDGQAPASYYERNKRRNALAARTDYVDHPAHPDDPDQTPSRWYDEEERLKYGDDEALADLWADDFTFHDGVIEGEWADVHWRIVGTDELRTETRVRVEPKSSAGLAWDDLPDYDQDRDEERFHVELDNKRMAELAEAVAAMRAAAGQA